MEVAGVLPAGRRFLTNSLNFFTGMAVGLSSGRARSVAVTVAMTRAKEKEEVMGARIMQSAALFACLTAGVAALGQQPPMPASLNPAAYGVISTSTEIGPHRFERVPAHLRTSQSYGLFADPYGFGSIPAEMER